ncbi:MAG TPA: sugar ABC transporter ATP-binding protein [Solirubrobacteraceae bacterium]|nr:sugar ABC transporter ATP-binding protein [Solirubrobacteraceae bacterium]
MAGVAPGSPSRRVFVELREIGKHFGGVRALDAVSISVEEGTVHALVGENGAGKSTLGKIIAGSLQPDAGEILADGEPVSFRSPREALAAGIAAIAQELLVVPRLSVAENVFLGAEPRRAGWVMRGSLRRRFDALATEAGFGLPADRPAGALRTAEQQQIEILRALARDARLIVMDEPSAALSEPDTVRLHEIIRSLTQAGKSVLLVSHFLREVLELADTVTVLRDGKLVHTKPTAEESEATLIQAMLGRPLDAAFPPKPSLRADAPVALSVRKLTAPGVSDASLEVRAGEIVGLAGLIGAGRSELVRAIYGADRRKDGEVELTGARLEGAAPLASLRRGLAMIPESRKDQGLLLSRSVFENVTLSHLGEFSRLGVVNRRAERSAASQVLDRVAVKGGDYASPVAALSGGNQQKVLFARMLMCGPRVLIADEPTRGVDVGAKRAIYDLLVGLAGQGMGVLLISSEVEEILGLSHRVLVMSRGRLVAELRGEEMTESAILAAAFAEKTAESHAA